MSEAALPGFDTSIWFGINAPAGLTDTIRNKLAAAVTSAVRSDPVAKAFRAQAIEPFEAGPAEYARYIAVETAKWADVVVKAGLAK